MVHMSELHHKEVGKCAFCGETIFATYQHGSKSWADTEEGPMHKECKKKYEEQKSE